MASQWHVLLMGEEIGPLSDQGLHEMVAKRQLTCDDMIRKASSSNWVPAGRLRGLFSQATVATTAQADAILSPSPSDAEAVRVVSTAENHAAPKFRKVTEPSLSQLVNCPDCGKRISPNASSCPNCGRAFFRPSRIVAIALALILGSFGAHKFYLGKPGRGVVYLLFFWTYIPGVIGIIEGLRYLFMNDGDFSSVYGSYTDKDLTPTVLSQHGETSSPHKARLHRKRQVQARNWVIGGVAALFVIGIIGIALDDDFSRGGSEIELGRAPSLRRETAAAINSEVYDRMVNLAIAKDYSGLETLLAAGLTFQLPKGTQVRVIDLGFLTTEIKVESGEHAGRYLIVATDNINR